jgi:hypothetical protein
VAIGAVKASMESLEKRGKKERKKQKTKPKKKCLLNCFYR